jgi:HPr kinase/phosphorylase
MARIKLEKFAKDLDLGILYDGDKEDIELTTASVNRPGLQLSGYLHYYATERVQIIGKVEMTYILEHISEDSIATVMDNMFEAPIPCVIICRGMQVPQALLDSAKKYRRPILTSEAVTTKVILDVITYLEAELSPRITRHGVLVDVNGVGMLLIGESGIGKSETALELVKRGHRLVADDVVEISRVAKDQLVGTAPESIRHFMELRGIGIIDVRQMYGIGSVLISKTIDMVVELEIWDNEKMYDRLGLEEEYMTLLGVKLPYLVVPVRTGRNLGIILEVAASNQQLKALGYNAAKELEKRFSQIMP